MPQWLQIVHLSCIIFDGNPVTLEKGRGTRVKHSCHLGCALPARNMKALSDDNYDNQESGRVFADSAHTDAASARNVTSTGVSPGRTEEGRLGYATVSGWGCSELFSRVFCSTLKA